ncbi:MAG: spinster family MFS transporter [Gammaproteobacteria bacterium]
MRTTTPPPAYTLAALTLVGALTVVDRQILSMLMPPIKADLGLSDSQLGFLSGLSFALFYAFFSLPIAALADRTSRKWVVVASLAAFSTLTAACGAAASYVQLLAARFGVAIGEAGVYPAAHSMISDLAPAARRARAMGIFSLSVPAGMFIGMFAGGWIAQFHGWRAAFFAVGLPGLLVAAWLGWWMREPRREAAAGAAERIPLAQAWQVLRARRAIRHIVLGNALVVFSNASLAIWMPTYLQRTFDLGLHVIGTAMALMAGVAGAAATYLSGWGADRLGRRDLRWNMWLPCLALAAVLPANIVVLTTGSPAVALAALVIPVSCGAYHSPPSYAMLQGLVPPRMRALVTAVLFFFINVVGMGLGPQLVGLLSDWLAQPAGADALRWAMLGLVAPGAWGAIHFALAARSLRADWAVAAGEAQPAAGG